MGLGVVAHDFNPSTLWEAEACGSLLSPANLHSEHQASQNDMVRLVSKQTNKYEW